MHVDSSSAPPTDVSSVANSTSGPGMPDFDARWSAWQRRGLEQERVARGRFLIVAPIVLLAAAIAFLVLGR